MLINRLKNKIGFTLIEICVTILIIGVIASIALPGYYALVEKARATKAIAFGRIVMETVNKSRIITGKIPTDLTKIGLSLEGSTVINPTSIQMRDFNVLYTINKGCSTLQMQSDVMDDSFYQIDIETCSDMIVNAFCGARNGTPGEKVCFKMAPRYNERSNHGYNWYHIQ